MELLPLTSIYIDESVSPRGHDLNLDYIDQLRDCLDALPPVAVFVVGEKKVLVDGFHRFHAFAAAKREVIPVTVVGNRTITEAKDYADLANLQHGLRLTKPQRREVARRFHMRHPDLSARRLGEMMGIAHTTVLAYWEEGCGPGRIHKAPLSSTEQGTKPGYSEPASACSLNDRTPPGPASEHGSGTGALHHQKKCACPKCGYEFTPGGETYHRAA